MTATGRVRGHAVEWQDGAQEWVYSDDKGDATDRRSCPACDMPPTIEGYDACLGYIPGAVNACCGHGDHSRAYIQMDNGNISRGIKAILIQEELV